VGALVDVENSIAWTGDFCIEPTPEGCWQAGSRAGQLLARAIRKDGHLDVGRHLVLDALLPSWEYHFTREGDEDLAILTFTAEPQASAYRGTCNWEQVEKIMEERVRRGDFFDSDHLWLDHLPKTAQQKFAGSMRSRNGDNSFYPIRRPKAVQQGAASSIEDSEVPDGKRSLRVAIVGSGPAAMFCADRLAELAQSGEAHLDGPVHLFRSRSKLSASQMEIEHNTIYPRPGAAFFDYGCQYITAGDAWFKSKMESFEAKGFCHRWPVGVLSHEHGFESIKPAPGWAGAEGMWVLQEKMVGQIAAERGQHLELHHSVAHWPPTPGQKFPDQSPLVVENYEKNKDGTWTLWNAKGESFGPFDVLVGAYASHNHTNVQLRNAATQRMRDYLHDNLRFSPVITAMVIFRQPLKLAFNAAYVVGDARLAWASNNNRKVGQNIAFKADGREFWTFMAPAKYSFESFETDGRGYKKRAFNDFITAFSELVGLNLWQYEPYMVRALHWEAGLPCTTLPSEAGCLFDAEQSLGWCGQWATHGGVEGAALSGKCMAELVAGITRGIELPAGAVYPEGAWPDVGCRVTPGYVRLGHGFFHIQHPRLQSIDPPASSLSAKDTSAFWSQHSAWGYGGKARSRGQDPNGHPGGRPGGLLGGKAHGRWAAKDAERTEICGAATGGHNNSHARGEGERQPKRRWMVSRGSPRQ